MGMYDTIEIKEPINNIDIKPGYYQSKCLNLALDTYYILPDGKLVLIEHYTEGRYWDSELPKQYPAWCKGLTGGFEIHDGKNSYMLIVEDGIVTKTVDWDDEYPEVDFNDVEWVYEF